MCIWHLYTVPGTVVFYDIVIMYDVLLVLFIHSGFLPETIGRHTWTVYKKWNIAADMFCFVFFPHVFWVSLFKRGPASKIDAAGSACRGRLFAPSSQILGINRPCLVLRIGATAGPPSPICLKRHWGKQDFLLRCHWLPFMEWEPSLGLVFFCTFVATPSAKVCKCALPS